MWVKLLSVSVRFFTESYENLKFEKFDGPRRKKQKRKMLRKVFKCIVKNMNNNVNRDGRAFLILPSRVPGVLGTWARGYANFVHERGNAERERIGTLILRSCGEIHCTVEHIRTVNISVQYVW